METERRARWLGAGVLLFAGAQYAWNLSTLPPLTGYDADGHLHVVATLLDEGRLPHPLEGWSTFHPPLYHAVVALIEAPLGPAWHPLLVAAVSALSVLLVGAVAFRVTRSLGHAPAVAAVATLVLLFTPCVQLAAVTVGNEALAAAFCAVALAGAVGLQRDPRDARLAAISGLALGLALATKASALLLAPACAVPFLRRGLCHRERRAALVLLGIALVVGAPAYLRNAALTGTPLPMTRELPWVALNEQALTLRARRAADYLWFDPAVFADPLVADPASPRGLNPSMTNVWGLLYASTWFDAHGLRTGDLSRAQALTMGRVLLAAGLLPTGLVLLGFALALRDGVRARGASRDAPLVVAALGGLAGLTAFTLRAPTTAAVKGAYLLPVALCAPVFFARGIAVLRPAWGRVALAGATFCGLAAALLLANGVWLPVHRAPEPGPQPSALAAVASELEAASAGRWRGIRVEPAADGALVWRLEAFAYAPLTPRRLGVWCDLLRFEMGRHLPREHWRAVVGIEGGNDIDPCRARGTGSDPPRRP